MFYSEELCAGALQRGEANVLAFLEKEKETSLGSTTCLRGKMLKFGEKWHRICKSLEAWTRMHWRWWEQCHLMANCGLSRFKNSSKAGKLNKAFLYSSPPTDRAHPKGHVNPGMLVPPSLWSPLVAWALCGLFWFEIGRRPVQEVWSMEETCF